MKRLMLLAVGLLACSGVASAEDVFVAGVGSKTCATFLRVDEAGLGRPFSDWAQGFLAGKNDSLLEDASSYAPMPSPEAITSWLKNYCKKQPNIYYGVALSHLYHSLQKKPVIYESVIK